MNHSLLDSLINIAKSRIVVALNRIPVSQDDIATASRIADAGDKDFVERLERLDARMTDGIWTVFALAQMTEETTSRSDASLAAMHQVWDLISGPEQSGPMLAAIIQALGAIAACNLSVGDKIGEQNQLSERLVELSAAVEADGDPDTAYDLAATAIDVGIDSRIRLIAAERALTLAKAAKRDHQVAMCSMATAVCQVELADADLSLRLAAFDACERAIEFAALTKEKFKVIVAKQMLPIVSERPYLIVLAPMISFLLPDHPARSALLDILKTNHWPSRISTVERAEIPAYLFAVTRLPVLTEEIDAQRFKLEAPPPQNVAKVDWIDWTLDHPAYRRAVQHGRSFLRERDFAQHLLVLTHEVTHSLCLVGALGQASLALRSTNLMLEAQLWKEVGGNIEDLENLGVSPLPADRIDLAPQAAFGLALSLKSQSLLDVWAPWLEGLAIFNESAADPTLDDFRVGAVTSILRNLIDFEPNTIDDTNADYRAAYEKFAKDFDARYANAINRRAPDRLYDMFVSDQSRGLYVAGYLTVRSVVSAWRKNTAKAYTGPEVVELLLHATRFGVRDAIPDFGLPPEVFAEQAQLLMIAWVENLANLPSEDIHTFLTPPPRAGRNETFIWQNGHPVVTNAPPTLREPIHEWAKQIMISGGYGGEATLEDAVDIAETMLLSQSMLPIGRTDATFYFVIDEASGVGRLTTLLRTTEADAETGKPGLDGRSIGLDADITARLTETHRRNGSPRIRITRIADLAGQATDPPLGVHMLAWNYDGQFLVEGSSRGAQAMLAADLDRFARAKEMIEFRLSPPPIVQAEMKWLASGQPAANRAIAWLDDLARPGVTDWSADTAYAMANLCARVREYAGQLVDESRRETARKDIALALLGSRYGDGRLAEALVSDGLAWLPAKDHDAVIKCMISTSQTLTENDWLDKNYEQLESLNFSIFEKNGLTWDVYCRRT